MVFGEGIDLSRIWRSINSLSSWSSRFGTYVYGRFDDLKDDVYDLTDDIYSVQKSITDIRALVADQITSAIDDLKNYVKVDLVDPLTDRVDLTLNIFRSKIDNIGSDLNDLFDGLETVFKILDRIDQIIDDRIEGFKDKFIGWIQDKFISIVEYVLEQEVEK